MSSQFFIVLPEKNLEKLIAGLKDLAPNILNRITYRAIDHALHVMRTEAWHAVRDTYNIKQEDFYKGLEMLKPEPGNLDGVLLMRAHHTPISYFKMSPPEPMPGEQPTVTFSIRKGETKSIRGAFVARMQSGHKGLFVRESEDQYPISQKFTIGPAEMLSSKPTRVRIEAAALEAFQEEFERQADLAFKKALDHRG